MMTILMLFERANEGGLFSRGIDELGDELNIYFWAVAVIFSRKRTINPISIVSPSISGFSMIRFI